VENTAVCVWWQEGTASRVRTLKLHDKQRRLLQALLEKTEARTPRGCAGPAMTVRTHLVLAGPPVPPAGSAAAAEEEAEVE
jgi:hypothetical protein